jgi:F-type H+-transporting ATPase subunit b
MKARTTQARTTKASTTKAGAAMPGKTMKTGTPTPVIAISRNLVLALLLLSCASVVSLHAQQPASPPKQEVTSEPEQRHPGPGRQLAHESNEAAGEGKDEMAEFKQSASVELIKRITGLSLQQSYWLCVVTNFVVIAAVIVWAARKYLPGLFRDRTAAIQKAMQEAQKASEEARHRLADIESRLMKLDSEIAAMRAAAEKEGAAEEARIKTAAEEDARKIIASAEQEIAAAAKAARRQLTAHAADLAVGLAQKQIRVDAPTDQSLVRNFSTHLSATVDDIGSDGRKARN